MTQYAFYPFPFGLLKIGYEGDTVVYLKGCEGADAPHNPTPLTEQVHSQVMEYLAGARKEFSFTYKMEGTPFQKRVWTALCTIPYGQTCSYQHIATCIGNPKACRAVGMANNRNPLTLVVPCHRVVGKNGGLVGYAGGLKMKEFLLDLEGNNEKKTPVPR